jgi:hypothetical protein
VICGAFLVDVGIEGLACRAVVAAPAGAATARPSAPLRPRIDAIASSRTLLDLPFIETTSCELSNEWVVPAASRAPLVPCHPVVLVC